MGFFPVGDDADLEAGVSAYTGVHDPYTGDNFWYWNADFKYRYRPSSYTSLVVQGEYLFNTRDAVQGPDLVPFVDDRGNPERRSITSGGLYLYADWQFLKVFSAGGRFDWSQSPYSTDDAPPGFPSSSGITPLKRRSDCGSNTSICGPTSGRRGAGGEFHRPADRFLPRSAQGPSILSGTEPDDGAKP